MLLELIGFIKTTNYVLIVTNDEVLYGLGSFISVPTESQTGAIVGGIFAVIGVILIAVAVVILYKRYTKEKITN